MRRKELMLCTCVALALVTLTVLPAQAGTGWDYDLETAYGYCGAQLYMEVGGQWNDTDGKYGYRQVVNHAATMSSGQAEPVGNISMWCQSMQYNKYPNDTEYEHGEINGFPIVSYEWDGYETGKGTIVAQAKAKCWFYCPDHEYFSIETAWALIWNFTL